MNRVLVAVVSFMVASAAWAQANAETVSAPGNSPSAKDQGVALAAEGGAGSAAAPEASASAPAAPGAASSPAATATTAAAPAVEAKADEDKGGFSLGLDLDHSVGLGTFVNSTYYSLLVGSLVASPSYTFKLGPVKLAVSAKESFSWEYTLPDNDNGRRYSWTDPRLGLAAPGLFKEPFTGIAFTPNLGATIPLSLESQFASTITTVSAGLGLSRSLWKFDLGYKIGGSRGFHGNAAKVPSKELGKSDDLGQLVFVCRTDEKYCGSAGLNTAWSLSNGLSLGFSPIEPLAFEAGYTIVNAWKYASTDVVDEYTPKALDSNGNSVARAGMGRSDKVVASVGATWAFNDRLSASLGVGTEGPAKTNNNKSFRFPFFDFVSSADNLTAFSLTLSAAF